MRFRPALIPTLIALPLFMLALGLGVWQLERRDWKLGLIAEMQTRLNEPPATLGDLEALAARGVSVAYRPVIAEGRFDHAHEMLWFTPGPEGEPGYHVITPLIPAEGPAVLIDRGFVPVERKDPESRAGSAIQDPVRLKGIARESQKPGRFTPEDVPAARMVYARDVAKIAAEIGLSPVAPFFVEADATPNPGGYPIGGQTKVTLRNEHLQYALTWFALALTLLMVYLLYHRR